MRLFTKQELIASIREISARGWHRSVKSTIDARNDGAVGNTLESLLGITENNLPIPNAREWELKGQRAQCSSLITLKHIEPSPTAARIVSNVLLPNYGWGHQKAGISYPKSEMSFRSTTSAATFTNRGFIISVNKKEKKVRFVFDAERADRADPKISAWLASVERRVGLGPIIPEPYWGFEDLRYAIGNKMKNCFYVVADTQTRDGHEMFSYRNLYVLSGFSFDKFIDSIVSGALLVDFDARTGHNHGTKFRLKQGAWATLYDDVKKAF